MNEQIIIKILVEAGGKLWQKQTERGNYSRVYFNSDTIAEAIGLEISRYHSGNISGASLDGDGISNSEGGRILSYLGGKFYFDFSDGQFHCPPSQRDYDSYVWQWFAILRKKINEANTEDVEIENRLMEILA